jgi:hypothetical protein
MSREDSTLNDCEVTLVANKSSPANGPHGIKFYINPKSGKVDLKTPLSVASSQYGCRSLGRMTTGEPVDSQFHSLVSTEPINVVGIPNYCTATRSSGSLRTNDTGRKGSRGRKAASTESATFSIYSDITDLKSLLRRQQKILPAPEEEEEEAVDVDDVWNLNGDAKDICGDVIVCTTDDDDDDSSDLASPQIEAASCCSSSSKNSSAVVLPTGCHKHPRETSALLPLLLRPRGSEEEDDYLDSLLRDDLDYERRSSSASALFEVTRPPRLLDEDDEVKEEEDEKSKKKKVRSLRSGSSGGKFSYSAMSLSNSRILRRHTTYIKSTSNVADAVAASEAEEKSLTRPHIHSWHRKKKNMQRRRMMIWNAAKVGAKSCFFPVFGDKIKSSTVFYRGRGIIFIREKGGSKKGFSASCCCCCCCWYTSQKTLLGC